MRKLTTVLDFETNGFQGSEVLSMSLRHSNGEKITRYYYPIEAYNEKAIAINGLTRERVTELRGDAPYPHYFHHDREVASMFFETETLVAHNIAFDYSFLPIDVQAMDMKLFCTMKSNAKYFEKNPNLKECAAFYGISFDENELHGSDYDTMLCEQIYTRMKEEDKTPNEDFLTKVYAARNAWGEKIHPFGQLKGLSVEAMSLSDMKLFLEKYRCEAAHEMFIEVKEKFQAWCL